MSEGTWIPVLIIIGCVVVTAVVSYLTRRRIAPWDIAPNPVPNPPFDTIDGPDTSSPSPDLSDWHQRYEQLVVTWIETHQSALHRLSSSNLQLDVQSGQELIAGHEQLAPGMREAIASHPSTVMRAELSALHVAGEATLFAILRGDYETARSQHRIYLQYRDDWIERLRQFSDNRSAMSGLYAMVTGPDLELEQIRSAFAVALQESEAMAEAKRPVADNGTEHEAQDMTSQDAASQSTTSQDAGDVTQQISMVELLGEDPQPSSAAVDVAVGEPNDTTHILGWGRIRRLFKKTTPPEDT